MSITIHLYYTGKNGSARKFVEEMQETAALIRAEEGNLGYDYYFSASDPETVLLVDRWRDQKALDVHHDSPMMGKVLALRKKYDLTVRAERFLSDDGFTGNDKKFLQKDASVKSYDFYGWKEADITPIADEYKAVENPRVLYDLLSDIWSAETCAPRLRPTWSKENKTLGQCSITSFLVQDIFGGKVYGVPLPEGGFHCFNEVGGVVFDLTDAQFGGKELCYDLDHEQFREKHFSDPDKLARYTLLKDELNKKLKK